MPYWAQQQPTYCLLRFTDTVKKAGLYKERGKQTCAGRVQKREVHSRYEKRRFEPALNRESKAQARIEM